MSVKSLMSCASQLLTLTQNQSTERGKWVMGIEEGTYWDEHWVLYGNQFDKKLYLKSLSPG